MVHTVSASGGQPVIHRYVYPHTEDEEANAPQPEFEYTPDSLLIHRVRVFAPPSSYRYYEDFVRTAGELLEAHGSPCAPVPYFSYVPQYAQLNRRQLAWYLYLRECVRNREFPDTDYSYVLLLVYEILNLADRIAAAQGQELLCGIWSGYRGRFPRLDLYLPEWICDYSLLRRLPAPVCLDAGERAEIMRHCSLREFYVSGRDRQAWGQALMEFCCNYDYRKSKFCTPENRALFDRVMTEVLGREGGPGAGALLGDCVRRREAYSGALCSGPIRRRLEISYCSFSRSHELRFTVTDALKHAENRLRAALGVRSRLTVYALPASPLGKEIDECVAALLPAARPAKKQAEPEPAYERLYDLPDKPLNIADAAAIERRSWRTTQRLVEAFAEEEPRAAAAAPLLRQPVPAAPTGPSAPSAPATPSAPSVPSVSAAPSVPSVGSGLPAMAAPPGPGPAGAAADGGLRDALAPYRAFLAAVLRGDSSAQRAEAARLGRLPDAVADAVNELVSDATGDILLEDAGDGYCVIAEYRPLLEGFFPATP